MTLEITERVALTTDEATATTLAALKALGVRLAVDDFGTGYSGLSALRDAPIDTVKIDRAFIARLGSAERDTEIVRAVIALAAALGLQITAEGVETAAQASILRFLGCPHAQGFHFARPLPPAALATLLANQGTCPASSVLTNRDFAARRLCRFGAHPAFAAVALVCALGDSLAGKAACAIS